MANNQDDTQVDASSASTGTEDVASADAQPSDSSNAQNTPVAPKTLMDVVKNIVQAPPTEDEPASDEGTPEPAEDEQKADLPVVPPVPQDKPTDTKGPIPYERFAEVNEAKKTLEQQFETVKPDVEAYRGWVEYLQQNDITPDEFTFWMDVAAAVKNDPDKAVKLMQPHIQGLLGYQGEALPPELQKAVEAGDISADYAKKLAANMNQNQFRQQQLQRQQEAMQRQAVQQNQMRINSALNAWTTTKASSDPAMKPKAPDASDGKFELVLAKYHMEARGARTPEEFVAAAERAYKAVDASFKTLTTQPRQNRPVVKSTLSTAQARNNKPKTLTEVIKARLQAHAPVS